MRNLLEKKLLNKKYKQIDRKKNLSIIVITTTSTGSQVLSCFNFDSIFNQFRITHVDYQLQIICLRLGLTIHCVNRVCFFYIFIFCCSSSFYYTYESTWEYRAPDENSNHFIEHMAPDTRIGRHIANAVIQNWLKYFEYIDHMKFSGSWFSFRDDTIALLLWHFKLMKKFFLTKKNHDIRDWNGTLTTYDCAFKHLSSYLLPFNQVTAERIYRLLTFLRSTM